MALVGFGLLISCVREESWPYGERLEECWCFFPCSSHLRVRSYIATAKSLCSFSLLLVLMFCYTGAQSLLLVSHIS